MKHQGLPVVVLMVGALIMGCGGESTGPGSTIPSISGLSAEPDTVDPTGTCMVTCTAADRDGDDLAYTWTAEEGTLSGAGVWVTWTAPLAPGTYQIYVTVDDGDGHSVSDSTPVEVRGATLLMKTWDSLTAVGMDGTSFVLYADFVDVEVLGTRIFIGPSDVREIDYTGQVIGGPGRPAEVTRVNSFTMLPDGGVAFAENSTDTVFFVNSDGAFLDAVQLPDASSHNQWMSGIVVGNDLIISETGARRIARIDLASHQVAIFKDLTQLDGWLGDIDYAEGCFYLTQWESLHRFTETGEPEEIAHFEEGSILSVAVVGTSAFTVSRDEGRIYRVDLPTGAVEVFAEGFDRPYEIEYLPVGLSAP